MSKLTNRKLGLISRDSPIMHYFCTANNDLTEIVLTTKNSKLRYQLDMFFRLHLYRIKDTVPIRKIIVPTFYQLKNFSLDQNDTCPSVGLSIEVHVQTNQ